MAVTTYAFEELFAEKVRALAERLRPRDVYDVVHLHRHRELRPERGSVLETLRQKCDFKGIPVPTLHGIHESPLVVVASKRPKVLFERLRELPEAAERRAVSGQWRPQ
jgi:predicted nucleotidyltransferase component of viral defense system